MGHLQACFHGIEVNDDSGKNITLSTCNFLYKPPFKTRVFVITRILRCKYARILRVTVRTLSTPIKTTILGNFYPIFALKQWDSLVKCMF